LLTVTDFEPVMVPAPALRTPDVRDTAEEADRIGVLLALAPEEPWCGLLHAATGISKTTIPYCTVWFIIFTVSRSAHVNGVMGFAEQCMGAVIAPNDVEARLQPGRPNIHFAGDGLWNCDDLAEVLGGAIQLRDCHGSTRRHFPVPNPNGSSSLDRSRQRSNPVMGTIFGTYRTRSPVDVVHPEDPQPTLRVG